MSPIRTSRSLAIAGDVGTLEPVLTVKFAENILLMEKMDPVEEASSLPVFLESHRFPCFDAYPLVNKRFAIENGPVETVSCPKKNTDFL